MSHVPNKASTELVVDGEYPYEYYGYGEGGTSIKLHARRAYRAASVSQSGAARARWMRATSTDSNPILVGYDYQMSL